MATVKGKFGFPQLRVSGTPVEAQAAGNCLEYRAGGRRRYGVAGAASTKFAGIALHDVGVTSTYLGQLKVGDENAQVAQKGGVFPVVASGAIAEGDTLVCAAAGKVSAAGATPDAREVIGRATEAAADGATLEAEIWF